MNKEKGTQKSQRYAGIQNNRYFCDFCVTLIKQFKCFRGQSNAIIIVYQNNFYVFV